MEPSFDHWHILPQEALLYFGLGGGGDRRIGGCADGNDPWQHPDAKTMPIFTTPIREIF